MRATLLAGPFHRDGWIYEEKVDGWRIVADKDGCYPATIESPTDETPAPPPMVGSRE